MLKKEYVIKTLKDLHVIFFTFLRLFYGVYSDAISDVFI